LRYRNPVRRSAFRSCSEDRSRLAQHWKAPTVTYEEIEAEASRFVASFRRPVPPQAKALFAAFSQHTSGLAVVERCPYCGGLLSVTELSPEAWSVSCPCGRSHDTLKGL
jgi:NADH pyrophosphatase NudC (nudix superfamily)